MTNKREDLHSYGEIQFSHNHICKFMEIHRNFLNSNQAIKVFIMSRRFRLALKYLLESGVDFDIEFFTFAIEANAYDIIFFLKNRYEEQIFAENVKAIDAHV